VTQDCSDPAISVVIPAREEARHLEGAVSAVLAAVARLGQPAELLIVEGQSRDGTRQIAEHLAHRHPAIRVLDNPARTTPAAFNLGIRQARAPVIAIIGGHSEVTEEFLAAGLRRLTVGDADIVGGPIRTEPAAPGMEAWLAAQVVSHPFGVGNSRFRVSRRESYVDAVPFALFRRQVFERVGLFNEVLVRNQDTEFFGRVRRAGLRVLLDPQLGTVYRARGTVAGLLRQGYANAYWNILVWRLNPDAFQWRHAIPGIFATGVVVLALSGFLVPGAWRVLAAVVAGHLGAGIVASGTITRRTGRALAFLLPPLFLLYHLGYGTGSLAGALAFLGRRLPPAAPPALAVSAAPGPPAPDLGA
jgi:hypothetical protein